MRRVAAWSPPHKAHVTRVHEKLTALKTDADKNGRIMLAGALFEARRALNDEWTRAWEHKLSLAQLDSGARTGWASTVGYTVGPRAPQINRPAAPAAAPAADAHALIEQRLTEHLVVLETRVIELGAAYDAGDYDRALTLANELVKQVDGWVPGWAGAAAPAAPVPAPAAAAAPVPAPAAPAATASAAPAIVVEAEAVTAAATSSATSGSDGSPANV
jgi:hypothetical protein